MPIVHKFINDLIELEERQSFCGSPIQRESNILFVGTFNPSDDSCIPQNDATWFYGRNRNKFWKYMPCALTGESLHPSDREIDTPQIWKDYCVNNKLVIIDLIKCIDVNDILLNFGDREVDSKINLDISNVDRFKAKIAFDGIQFKKVIYSLAWTDRNIHHLTFLRDKLNCELVQLGCINDFNQIHYCLSPSINRGGAFESWFNAIRF